MSIKEKIRLSFKKGAFMDQKLFKQALNLAGNKGKVFLASADDEGNPYMVAAEKIDPLFENFVEIKRCLCSQTIRNLWENPHLALYIWPGDNEPGYQMTGVLSEIKDLPFSGKSLSEKNDDKSEKDSEVRLIVKIEKVIKMDYL
jgi:hypothetical protein